MPKFRIFRILSVSFILGIASVSFYWPHTLADFYLCLIATLILIILFVFYKEKLVVIVGFSGLFFLLGIFLVNNKLSNLNNLTLDGKEFSGEVMVAKDPEQKDDYQRFTAVETPHRGVSTADNGKFLINTNLHSDYSYGEVLKISCLLKRPESRSNSNSSERSASSGQSAGSGPFDYRLYLAKDNIYYICQKSKIEKLGKNEGNEIYKFVLGVKNKVENKMERLVPSPESGLLVGLLLGGNDNLSKNVQDDFSKTGMTHIVAVSGYNITIIAQYLILLGIFFGLWRRQSFWFAVTGIFLFIFMIGFPSSAVRAGVMGTLLLWAMKNGRLGNAQNAILCSASIMLLLNPMLLRWDIGFQLSFLATLGLMYVYPFFNKYVVKNHKSFGITETLFLTLSAQIFVLPIIFYNFGTLSLISPLANILVLPIIPITMLLGFIMVIASFIFPPMAIILAWLVYLPLRYETLIINFLASLKYSAVAINNFPWWGVLLWYIILFIGIHLINRKVTISERHHI